MEEAEDEVIEVGEPNFGSPGSVSPVSPAYDRSLFSEGSGYRIETEDMFRLRLAKCE